MTRQADVVIIGAGIIGCTTAFELSKRGYRTLNVDKLAEAGSGSTINSCANIRAHYSTYEGVALAYDNFSYWKNWGRYLGLADPRGLARFVNCGTILLKTQGHRWEKILQHYRDIGVEHEEWNLTTLRERAPLYSTKSCFPPAPIEDSGHSFWQDSDSHISGAIFTPGSGYVSDPRLATQNVQAAAEARGATFQFGARVVEIRSDGGRVRGVALSDGCRIDAPVVVNIAGPHSFVINRMAGVERGMNVKTRALRHEVHHVPPPDGFDFLNRGHHTSDGDTGVYFRPEAGNNILVGSQDPACDSKHWVADPDVFDREVTEEQWKAQVYRLARRIPRLRIPSRPKGVVDLYDVSDDWLPIYDKSDLGGFYMAIGTSGHEFKNAPGVGHIMAGLIEACEAGRDHDRDPLHVTTPNKGLELNVGFFSRLREINPDSSFSVNG